MTPLPRWTGGQYSLWRAALGLGLALWAIGALLAALARPGGPGLALPAIFGGLAMASVALAIGWGDRFGAAAILAGGAILAMQAPELLSPGLVLTAWLLLAHLLLPPAPYGSVAAIGRLDPGGGWRMPLPIWIGYWAALTAGVILRLAAPGLVRGLAWPAGMAMTALLAFDPGWIKGRGGDTTETLFYDGTCGLCHRTVRFLLAEDLSGKRFRFAPLQGRLFRNEVPEAVRRDLPDSLVLLRQDGTILTRWRAVVRLLLRLGGYWTILGGAKALVPTPLGDAAYDLVARVRHAIFPPPPNACPLAPPALMKRFILD